MTITALPTAPSRSDDPSSFASNADAWVGAIADWTTEVNALSSDLAGLETAAPSILALANFGGTWNSGTAYTVPASVYYASTIWVALQAGTNQTPATGSAYWAELDLYHSLATHAVSAWDVDCRLGSYFTKTMTAGGTFTFSNPPSGRAYSFTLEITHTSGADPVWPAAVKWPENTTPTLSTGKVHLFTFTTSNGGTTWRAGVLANYTA